MSDLTTKVLIEIRDEIRSTRQELREEIRATNTRIDATNSRLDTTNTKLDFLARRQTEVELRVATELVGVRDAVGQLVEMHRADRELRHDVENLKERVANLESKAG